MSSRAYYNENDPFAANWLRNLIDAGLIMPGEVDDRSIHDVQASDLDGFTRCHFFAGIGGWDYALRLAGWPDDRPVWSGSCPCPPFSISGKKKRCPECDEKPIPHPLKTGVFACIECGHEWFADARHLWPELYRLIRDYQAEVGPLPAIFGEQVAGPDGLVWLDGVRATLEALGLAVAGSDLCAAGVNAPHIRQRIFWLADSSIAASERHARGVSAAQDGIDAAGEPVDGRHDFRPTDGSEVRRGLGDPEHLQAGSGNAGEQGQPAQHWRDRPANASPTGVAQGDTIDAGLQGHAEHGGDGDQPGRLDTPAHGSTGSPGWGDFELVRCVEPTKEPGRCVEKRRRVEPGTFPLAHGLPDRVGRLRGYGNAIVPQVAAEFIAAYMECVR